MGKLYRCTDGSEEEASGTGHICIVGSSAR
jgi:hypothetical protein